MKKRKLSVLSLGMLLAVTGCGASDVIHNVDQNLSHEEPSGVVTIKFWHCLGHDKATHLDEVIKKFNDANPHYKVVATSPGGGYSGLHKAVKNAIRAGTPPHMAIGYPDSFSEYMGTTLNRSNILRLNNFYVDEMYGYQPGEPVEEGIQEEGNFIKAYYDEGLGYQFDGLWSLPMYKSTEVMFYNKDYFSGRNDVNKKMFGNTTWWKELAVDAFKDEEGNDLVYFSSTGHDAYDEALRVLKAKVIAEGGKTYEVPTTWDEMIEVATAVRADRVAANVYNEKFYPVGYDSDANLIISQLEQRGYTYTTNKNIKNKADHLQFNNQNTINLVTELLGYYTNKLMVTKGTLDSTSSTYVNDLFTGGEEGVINMVMSIGSTGGSDYQKTGKFAVGIAPVPYSNGVQKYIQQGPSICFFDSENEQVNTGSWLFYKAIADAEDNTILALENSYDPITKSAYESEAYEEFISDYRTALLNNVPIVTGTLKDKQFTSPVFVGSSTAREQMAMLLAYCRWQSYTAKGAVEQAYKATLNKTKK